ncbi:MAG: UvrD-helicase domain-containing protein [Spirochaetales bacterium]|nr:UvrD-helicase domain-containing protein [Spirochaetales bacterium]
MDWDLTKELNTKQYQTVMTVDGPLLIIAGAGSGKTRTVTFRIAHMLKKGIPQSAILALTFTNKAAREMEERIRHITGKKLSALTVSTFHAFGVKVLRKSIHHLGYREHFSIYDESDKVSLLKEVCRELKVAPDAVDFWELSQTISAVKTGRSIWTGENSHYRKFYDEYAEHMVLYNAVDFDDLIVLPLRLFEEHPDVLESYRHRYRYIMVDEFQDTSIAQYKMMKLLAETNRNICVVGDDDQSIYSWRGANYQNIINFEKDFPELTEIKLEQNYRSTQNILAAANSVIANNTNRKEKELWTGTGEGKAIEIFYPENGVREAQFIAEMIRTIRFKEHIPYREIGILIRTNNLAAVIEEALLTEGIPYKVSGGTSFFSRKEIKDIIAYLRVITNPDDDINLLRIINTPRRGIGKKSLQIIRDVADGEECSIFSALSKIRYSKNSPLPEKSATDIENFLTLIDYYREHLLSGKNFAGHIRSLVDTIEYWTYLILENQKNEKAARWKFGNIGKFIEFVEQWERNQREEGHKPNIYQYLNRITLSTRDDAEDDSESGSVNLMTIHSAKGLEFDLVFLAGVESHLIPHARAVEENPESIEEERRLFYVAITRARQKLFMTSCRTRKSMKETIECAPSPFLEEIPKDLIEYHRPEEELTPEEAIQSLSSLRAKWSS